MQLLYVIPNAKAQTSEFSCRQIINRLLTVSSVNVNAALLLSHYAMFAPLIKLVSLTSRLTTVPGLVP